jgi:glycosyltransferase involved in cell wall biosynthesis
MRVESRLSGANGLGRAQGEGVVLLEALTAGPEASGVGQYGRLLIESLASTALRDRILVVTNDEWRPEQVPVVRVGSSARTPRAVAANLVLPLLCRRRDVRGFHTTDHGLSPLIPPRLPVLVTVHDVSFITHPTFFDPLTVAYKRRRLRVALQRATAIVAVSHSTAEALCTHAGVRPSQVMVVYPGLDPAIRRVETPRGSSPVIGFLGQLTTRKNLGTLVEAFRILRSRGTEVVLRLAGKPGHGWDEVAGKIAALPQGMRAGVRVVGPVPRAAVGRFLSALDVFVFPSWLEGFGFPPLEAMACGVPVVASDASCLPEILGDAALFAPPDDPGAFAEQIERLLLDACLSRTLVERGRARTARYRWERVVARLVDVYREVFGIG